VKTSIIAFLIAALVSILLTPLTRALATKLGVLDRPSEERKVHKAPIPRLGGLAIMVGTLAPLGGLYFYRNALSAIVYADGRQVAALLCATFLVVLAGVLDDMRGLSQKYRFVVEVVAALLVYWGGFQINGVYVPIVGHVELGVLALPVTVLWVVAVINALNFTDGLDGLAAGTAVLAGLTLLIFALSYHNYVAAVFSASIAGAAFGFLLFNFHPATVYMGDTGSMFLGLALAVASIGSSQKSATMVALLGPALILGLPIGDTVLRVVRRTILGRPWFPADRKHVHHRLLDLGLSQRSATLVLYGTTAVFCLAALAIAHGSRWMAVGVGFFVVGLVIFAVRRLGYVELNRFTEIRRRQSGAMAEDLASEVEERLADLANGRRGLFGSADFCEAFWKETVALAEGLLLDRVELVLTPAHAVLAKQTHLWRRTVAGQADKVGLELVWTPKEKSEFTLPIPLGFGVLQHGVLTFTRDPKTNLPISPVERMILRYWASSLALALDVEAPETARSA
jgi:UDP-GlcNAc:undecaprenyl-phosphate/decaprenyl-phosphate GlcNAc-1-phosphate transferase